MDAPEIDVEGWLAADGAPPYPEGDGVEERLTDLGNARRLARHYQRDLRYCYPLRRWYHYDEGAWSEDAEGWAMRYAKGTVQQMYGEAEQAQSSSERKALAQWALKSESSGRLNAMLELAQSEPGMAVLPDQFDRMTHLLNVTNGTLDMSALELLPHSPDYLLTTKLPFKYDPAATCPGWISFLERIFAGQPDMILFVRRAVGYSLTGSTGEQCFFFLYGSGANGKSVFLKTLLKLFGNGGRTANFSTFLHQRDGGRPRQDLARLAGARLVVAAEAGEGQRFDEELLKSVTGGEKITARKLYGEDFEFTPQFTLWLAANHRPVIRGADLAIWRRVCLVPFSQTIPEEERDPGLADRLAKELPGILNWALEGQADWHEHGLAKPAAVVMATEEYREASDPLQDFIDGCCVVSPQGSAKAAELYARYKSWCLDRGDHCPSQKWLGGQLRDRGFASVKSHGTYTYYGLSLSQETMGRNSAESLI